MASLVINLARIPDPAVSHPVSKAIMGGMTTWSFDRELSPTRFDDDKDVRRVEDGAIQTGVVAGVDQGRFPTYAAFSASTDDVTRKILVRAREYLTALDAEGAWWTDFVTYRALMATAGTDDDPQVLSVRSLADYRDRGHVPGATNVPWQQVAKLANAKLVDPTRKVFVYCYTGHTGGVATMALGILGYQTRNLLYGLNGWTSSSAVLGTSLRRFDVARAWDFPLHDTGDGGIASLDGYVPPATGCLGCHANLTALYSAYGYAEPAAAGVLSEGEG
jgi:rhodanese-related sulfurtransferase